MAYMLIPAEFCADFRSANDATSSASSSVTASSASSIKQTSSSAATTTSKAITNATIVVKYVNQNNQPIAAEKVLSGKVGTKYNATNLKKQLKATG